MNLFDAGVMNRRQAGTSEELDYFPTPPWATRAFLPLLRELDPGIESRVIWEPACGQGHMAVVLAELGARVFASDIEPRAWAPLARDIFEAGGQGAISCQDFLDPALEAFRADWIITNPPFNLAVEFVESALTRARIGVAVLCRSNWVEGADRYRRLFDPRPPFRIYQYVERVPMVKGRWDPSASTATPYAWFVWVLDRSGYQTRFRWIPPGQRARHNRPEDPAIFGAEVAPGLFGGNP
jgi:predicted RNA methylase